MARSRWHIWTDALRVFAGGFFEGPRFGSTGEPLRDDLLWAGPPPQGNPLAEAEPEAAPADPPATQLTNLMSGVGDSVRPTTTDHPRG